jgi:hypothetical protein
MSRIPGSPPVSRNFRQIAQHAGRSYTLDFPEDIDFLQKADAAG